jgi:hypothetical protein
MKQYKNSVKTIQNTVNTSTYITKTPTQLSKHPPTYTHPHITKQVKTSALQESSSSNQAVVTDLQFHSLHIQFSGGNEVASKDCGA